MLLRTSFDLVIPGFEATPEELRSILERLDMEPTSPSDPKSTQPSDTKPTQPSDPKTQPSDPKPNKPSDPKPSDRKPFKNQGRLLFRRGRGCVSFAPNDEVTIF